jgi:hypothetical protein
VVANLIRLALIPVALGLLILAEILADALDRRLVLYPWGWAVVGPVLAGLVAWWALAWKRWADRQAW